MGAKKQSGRCCIPLAYAFWDGESYRAYDLPSLSPQTEYCGRPMASHTWPSGLLKRCSWSDLRPGFAFLTQVVYNVTDLVEPLLDQVLSRSGKYARRTRFLHDTLGGGGYVEVCLPSMPIRGFQWTDVQMNGSWTAYA